MKPVEYLKNQVLPDRARTLMAILILTFIVRLIFVAILKPDGFYFSDTRHYDTAALHLLAGDGFGEKYNRSPVYPVYMALTYAVFGHSFVAMRFVETLLGVFLVWLIYHIARKAFNEKIAMISALLAALFPHFIILAGLLYPTNLFTVLLASSVYFMIKSEETDARRYLILSAISSGLATLTIPSMLFVLPFWLLLLMVRTQQSAQYNFVRTLAFCFIILLTLTPWTIRNFQKYDRLTLVRPVPHTAFPNLDDLDAQRQRIESGFEDTTDYLKNNPLGSDDDKIGNILGSYIRHPIRSIQYLFSELGHFWALYPDRLDTQSKAYQQKIQKKDHRLVSVKSLMWNIAIIASIAVMLPVFAFALFGLIVSRPVDRKKLLLLFTVVGMSVGYSLIYAEVRYRIPIEPYVLMFSAAGIARFSEFVHAAREKRQVRHHSNNMRQSTHALHPSWENHLTGTKK